MISAPQAAWLGSLAVAVAAVTGPANASAAQIAHAGHAPAPKASPSAAPAPGNRTEIRIERVIKTDAPAGDACCSPNGDAAGKSGAGKDACCAPDAGKPGKDDCCAPDAGKPGAHAGMKGGDDCCEAEGEGGDACCAPDGEGKGDMHGMHGEGMHGMHGMHGGPGMHGDGMHGMRGRWRMGMGNAWFGKEVRYLPQALATAGSGGNQYLVLGGGMAMGKSDNFSLGLQHNLAVQLMPSTGAGNWVAPYCGVLPRVGVNLGMARVDVGVLGGFGAMMRTVGTSVPGLPGDVMQFRFGWVLEPRLEIGVKSEHHGAALVATYLMTPNSNELGGVSLGVKFTTKGWGM